MWDYFYSSLQYVRSFCLAAVTHESTRQLLTATGLLPRNVVLPEWVQFGLPASFETPKYDLLSQAGAFWPTFGEPNWVYLTYYKLWEKEKEAGRDPRKAFEERGWEP